jgi:hypothetical protein
MKDIFKDEICKFLLQNSINRETFAVNSGEVKYNPPQNEFDSSH